MFPIKPLIDWVSCTFKGVKGIEGFFEHFFLEKEQFKQCQARLGYENGLRYQSITVWYNEGMSSTGKVYDICLNMSGQGCRCYETIRGDGFDWVAWLRDIKDAFPDVYHFSRIDVALDIADDTCPAMNKIVYAVKNRRYVSQFRRILWAGGAEEWVYFGSPESDTRLRIYNKALERGYPDTEKWVRFEYQLRNESAGRFLNHLLTCGELGQAYKDLIASQVTFTTKTNDMRVNSQRSMQPVLWWAKLVAGAGKVTRFEAPGVEYNLEYCHKYLNHQVGPSLAAYVSAHGGNVEPLLDLVKQNEYRMNTRQRNMVAAQQRLDALRKEIRENDEKECPPGFVEVDLSDTDIFDGGDDAP